MHEACPLPIKLSFSQPMDFLIFLIFTPRVGCKRGRTRSEWRLFGSMLLAELNHDMCLGLWKASGDSIPLYPIDTSQNKRFFFSV